MSKKLTSVVTSAAVVLTVHLAVTIGDAYAQNPEPILRTFMISGSPTSGPDQFPDVFSDPSRFIVTHSGQDSNGNSNPIVVWTANCEDDDVLFNNTKWKFGSYVTHVKSGRPETYFVFWLDDIPPSGAILYTGPDSLAITESAWRRTANFECDEANGSWIIERQPTANSFPVYIVTGLFSR